MKILHPKTKKKNPTCKNLHLWFKLVLFLSGYKPEQSFVRSALGDFGREGPVNAQWCLYLTPLVFFLFFCWDWRVSPARRCPFHPWKQLGPDPCSAGPQSRAPFSPVGRGNLPSSHPPATSHSAAEITLFILCVIVSSWMRKAMATLEWIGLACVRVLRDGEVLRLNFLRFDRKPTPGSGFKETATQIFFTVESKTPKSHCSQAVLNFFADDQLVSLVIL